jgi:hypothetical protein
MPMTIRRSASPFAVNAHACRLCAGRKWLTLVVGKGRPANRHTIISHQRPGFEYGFRHIPVVRDLSGACVMHSQYWA